VTLWRTSIRSGALVMCVLVCSCRPLDVSVELKATADDVFRRSNVTLTRDARSDLNDFINTGASRISRNSEEFPRAKADIARFAREAVRNADRVDGRLTITRRIIRTVKRIFCPCYPFC